MQASEHPLAQMRALHLPHGIDAWPLAPGWYVLASIILLTVTTLLFLFIRKRRAELYKRQALEALEQIKQHTQKDAESILAQSNELSDLLKRLALTHYPRSLISPLNGERWLQFLDEISGTNFFTQGDGKLLGASRFMKVNEQSLEKNNLEENYQSLMNCFDESETLIKNFNKKENGHK